MVGTLGRELEFQRVVKEGQDILSLSIYRGHDRANYRSTLLKLMSANKYTPISILGRGTWGVVTQCEREDGTIVALKTFEGADKSELVRWTSLYGWRSADMHEPTAEAQFAWKQICKVAVREARMLKLVVHPNVVSLLEVFR